ncbi:MAG: DUF3825 domain-containing protein [Desulfovibrio sp.]|nr:DUF3825 domain-containing protein [Desulfovibrio sp.]
MKLMEFAFIPQEKDSTGRFERHSWTKKLADMAITESWGQDNDYLNKYCVINFEIAYEQNLILENDNDEFAVWRIGHLTTSDGLPIYALFEKNSMEGKQPYYLKTFVRGSKIFFSKRDGTKISVDPTPEEPNYEIPKYDNKKIIQYNWDHYLSDRETRIKEILKINNERITYVSIFGAAELSHRLWRQCATPQYHNGRFQWLLPLYITQANYSARPDLVATLDEDGDNYLLRTLLPPEWAYPQARAVAVNTAQFRSWASSCS